MKKYLKSKYILIIGTVLITLFVIGIYNNIRTKDSDESLSLQKIWGEEKSLNLPGDPTTTRSFEEYGDYDCTDFDSHTDAQEFYEQSIEEFGFDYHELDRNEDGIACESLI